MSFPRYPSYKDSGVELLGDVPAHWQLKRFKRVFKEREERSVGGEELLLSVSAYTGVSPRSEVIDEGDHLSRADSLEGYKLCYKDDLVVNIMLAWNRGLAFTAHQGIVSPAYCVYFVIDGSDPRFLNYLVRSNEYTLYFKAFSSGVIDSRLRIYPETFGRLFCGIPPLDEQTRIADFLDRETGKIDELVAEQRRLMELMKEKRQAVISHAVTRGLNPAAPLKPSGIEWLIDIPVHWRVVSFKHLARAGAKTFTDGDWIEAPYITSDGVRLLQTGNVGIGYFKEQGFRYVSEETFNELRCTELKPRDVLICRLDGPVGRACLAPDLGVRMITSVDNAILKVADEVLPEFVVSLLSSVPWISWIDALCRVGGGFRLRISRSQLGEIRVPLPPLEEQLSIRERLGSLGEEFDTLTAEAQRAIDLLQERRTALISAAVTGQIDVRRTGP
ncbi:MAG: type restriction enzyme subunit [Chthoniobacter sp.]|nr:type restriction enzyme subunit [Chthoniobacter sp.]